eukprot:Opistho-2@67650
MSESGIKRDAEEVLANASSIATDPTFRTMGDLHEITKRSANYTIQAGDKNGDTDWEADRSSSTQNSAIHGASGSESDLTCAASPLFPPTDVSLAVREVHMADAYCAGDGPHHQVIPACTESTMRTLMSSSRLSDSDAYFAVDAATDSVAPVASMLCESTEDQSAACGDPFASLDSNGGSSNDDESERAPEENSGADSVSAAKPVLCAYTPHPNRSIAKNSMALHAGARARKSAASWKRKTRGAVEEKRSGSASAVEVQKSGECPV